VADGAGAWGAEERNIVGGGVRGTAGIGPSGWQEQGTKNLGGGCYRYIGATKSPFPQRGAWGLGAPESRPGRSFARTEGQVRWSSQPERGRSLVGVTVTIFRWVRAAGWKKRE